MDEVSYKSYKFNPSDFIYIQRPSRIMMAITFILLFPIIFLIMIMLLQHQIHSYMMGIALILTIVTLVCIKKPFYGISCAMGDCGLYARGRGLIPWPNIVRIAYRTPVLKMPKTNDISRIIGESLVPSHYGPRGQMMNMLSYWFYPSVDKTKEKRHEYDLPFVINAPAYGIYKRKFYAALDTYLKDHADWKNIRKDAFTLSNKNDQ